MIRLAAALASVLIATPAMAQDGAKLFAQRCKVCHGVASTPMGPTLTGSFGAKIASRPGFKFSNALSAKAGTWTEAQLDAWLAAPMKFAPGTRMVIAVPAAPDRAAIIAHLKTLK